MRTATRARHVLFVLLGTTWRWPRLATVRSAWPAPLTTTTHRRQIARRVLRASMLLRARLRRLALFASRGRRIWTAMRRRTATIAWLVGTLAWIGRLCASLVSRGSTLQQSQMLARTVLRGNQTWIAMQQRPVWPVSTASTCQQHPTAHALHVLQGRSAPLPIRRSRVPTVRWASMQPVV